MLWPKLDGHLFKRNPSIKLSGLKSIDIAWILHYDNHNNKTTSVYCFLFRGIMIWLSHGAPASTRIRPTMSLGISSSARSSSSGCPWNGPPEFGARYTVHTYCAGVSTDSTSRKRVTGLHLSPWDFCIDRYQLFIGETPFQADSSTVFVVLIRRSFSNLLAPYLALVKSPECVVGWISSRALELHPVAPPVTSPAWDTEQNNFKTSVQLGRQIQYAIPRAKTKFVVSSSILLRGVEVSIDTSERQIQWCRWKYKSSKSCVLILFLVRLIPIWADSCLWRSSIPTFITYVSPSRIGPTRILDPYATKFSFWCFRFGFLWTYLYLFPQYVEYDGRERSFAHYSGNFHNLIQQFTSCKNGRVKICEIRFRHIFR